MSSSNTANLELNTYEKAFSSLEAVKSLTTNPKLIPSVSSSFSTKPPQPNHVVKFLNGCYPTPDPPSGFSRTISNPIYPKKSENSEKASPDLRDLDCHHIPGFSSNPSKVSNYMGDSVVSRGKLSASNVHSEGTENTSNNLNKQRLQNDKEILTLRPSENETTSAKRDLGSTTIKDLTRKKLHTENQENSPNKEDDLEAFNFIQILDEEVIGYNSIEDQENQTITTPMTDTTQEIQAVTQKNSIKCTELKSDKSLQIDKISDPEPSQLGLFGAKGVKSTARRKDAVKSREVSKLLTKTITPTVTEELDLQDDLGIKILDTAELDDGMDVFGLDGLGIKILDEIFLCKQCHNEIPSNEQERDSKDTCWTCQRRESKTSCIIESKALVCEPALESESDFYSNSLGFPIRNDPNSITGDGFHTHPHSHLYLGSEINHEYDKDDEAWPNILDHIHHRPKALVIGQNYQAKIPILNIYNTKKRIIKRLWNPSKTKQAEFERLKSEINEKNMVYLIDEEVSEILIRNDYDAKRTLQWCVKSNSEFQFYIKRSSNRRRLMAKMGLDPVKGSLF